MSAFFLDAYSYDSLPSLSQGIGFKSGSDYQTADNAGAYMWELFYLHTHANQDITGLC